MAHIMTEGVPDHRRFLAMTVVESARGSSAWRRLHRLSRLLPPPPAASSGSQTPPHHHHPSVSRSVGWTTLRGQAGSAVRWQWDCGTNVVGGAPAPFDRFRGARRAVSNAGTPKHHVAPWCGYLAARLHPELPPTICTKTSGLAAPSRVEGRPTAHLTFSRSAVSSCFSASGQYSCSHSDIAIILLSYHDD